MNQISDPKGIPDESSRSDFALAVEIEAAIPKPRLELGDRATARVGDVEALRARQCGDAFGEAPISFGAVLLWLVDERVSTPWARTERPARFGSVAIILVRACVRAMSCRARSMLTPNASAICRSRRARDRAGERPAP
jgi:hypothetical protein